MAARSDFLLERVIGIHGEVGVCVVGENEIAYAAFNRVIIHNLETNCQRFIETGRGVSFLWQTMHAPFLLWHLNQIVHWSATTSPHCNANQN